MLDLVRFADHFEAHLAGPGGVSVTRLLGKLDAVSHQIVWMRYGTVFSGCSINALRCPAVGFVDQSGDGELPGGHY